jgi:hypothetical protein
MLVGLRTYQHPCIVQQFSESRLQSAAYDTIQNLHDTLRAVKSRVLQSHSSPQPVTHSSPCPGSSVHTGDHVQDTAWARIQAQNVFPVRERTHGVIRCYEVGWFKVWCYCDDKADDSH